MTEEFERAVRHVINDAKLDEGQAADLIAVGVWIERERWQ